MSLRNTFAPVAIGALTILPLLAAPTTITLATNIPAGTTWHKGLLDMANQLRQGTEGRVMVNIPAGGADEETAIKKMRADIYQAAFLTPTGLSALDEAFNVLSIPFFLESTDEEAAVLQALTPLIEKRLQPKNFHLLCWGNGGWVQLFSKNQLRTLAEVKAAKLFTSKGDDKWTQWYVTHRFNPVPLTLADIPTELKKPRGLIDAAPSPPYAAQTLQIYRDAKFMLDIRIAPFTAALVVSTAAWNRLSAEDRDKMTAAAQAFEKRIRLDAPGTDAASIKAMQARGLTVVPLDAAAAAEFRTAGSELSKSMRGGMVPADIYDTAVQARDAFRKSKGK